MFVLVLQELPDLLRPPEGSGACMDFADGSTIHLSDVLASTEGIKHLAKFITESGACNKPPTE